MSCLRAGHPPWHRKRTVAKREPLDVYEILEISSAVKKLEKLLIHL
jgi:NTP pyrophosphatase (non-canonical NTP hydrolase)